MALGRDGTLPPGPDGGQLCEGAAAAGDEAVGAVCRIVRERLDPQGGEVGVREQGTLEDVLTPVFRRADRGRYQGHEAGRREVGGEEAAVLCLPPP
ncbi:hypothetical protein J7W19_27400 [Streptomyces mobaraensis NBRC 13819 = DSM 40847]|uniref:hypothetical protein n=1 Tax=Streptomyces mobaraensis TaxID=35621 RepID=UPI000592FE46|nr:hypothetical protein [Streptomyces mobaraensis]QTT76607.1 hypothetical protein J7W19_27400 [Streptomyces mobaraensis NBRC 13819 = DSM 40847]